MALHWGLDKIDNWKHTCWDTIEGEDGSTLKPITEAIIWTSMIVDLGEISKENVNEWLWRMMFAATFCRSGKLYFDHISNRDPNRQEIEAHIGLWTNVTTKDRTAFVNRWIKYMKTETTRLVERNDTKEKVL